MSEQKKGRSPWHSRAFQHHEPMEQKKEPLHKGDLGLEEELEDELEDIEKIQEDPCVQAPQQCSVCDLEQQVNELKETITESHDKLLRAHAEMENIRNRAKQDVEKAHKYGLDRFIKELLPVVDNLELALESAGKQNLEQSVLEGVALTLKMFQKVLEQFGVKELDPLHQPFDPQTHEAMTVQKNTEVDPNTVLAVYQKGYLLNGRLVRPARVVVSS